MRWRRMITTIGTPASQRMISRNIAASLKSSSSRRANRPARAEIEPGGDRGIAVLTALERRPPGGPEREDQARGRHEAGQRGGTPGLVGCLARGGDGSIDPALRLLLG